MAERRNVFVTSADTSPGCEIVKTLVRECKEKVGEVHAGGTDEKKLQELKEIGAHVHVYSLTNIPGLVAAIAKSDVFCLIPPLDKEGTTLTRNLVEAALVAKVKAALMLSSYGVERGEGQYLKQWHQLEKSFTESNIPCKCILRIAMLQEVILSFALAVKEDQKLCLPLGDKKYSPICVFDAAKMAACLLVRGEHARDECKTYVATGPRLVSGEDVARAASEVLGTSIKYEDISLEKADEILKRNPRINDIKRHLIIEKWQLVKEGKVEHVTDDFEKVTRKKPNGIDAFFKEFADHFKPSQ